MEQKVVLYRFIRTVKNFDHYKNIYLLSFVYSLYECKFALCRFSSEDRQWSCYLTCICQRFSFYIKRYNVQTPTRHVMEIILVDAEPETRRKSLGSISITWFWHNSCSIFSSTLHDVISGLVNELDKSRKISSHFWKDDYLFWVRSSCINVGNNEIWNRNFIYHLNPSGFHIAMCLK